VNNAIYSFVLRYAVRDLFFVSIMSETTKTGDIGQDHNIIQDQPNSGRNLETRAKITQKNEAGHGIILKKWTLKSKQVIKENHLKGVNLLILKEINVELFILMMVQQEML